MRSLIRILATGLLAISSSFSALAGSPGCVGKMWNPLELDFTLMAPIKIYFFGATVPVLDLDNGLPSPRKHKVDYEPITGCFCKDGWNTGTGVGMTYWLPSYIMDVAKTPGCIGFLDGVQVLQRYRSLGGVEAQNQVRGLGNLINTTRQRHFGHADITSIIGKKLFEKCGSIAKGINIASMTEVCYPCQSDIWSALLVPIGQVLAAAPMLTTASCSVAKIAAAAGILQEDDFYPQCNFAGTRYPLSQNTPPGASSAQAINADQNAKHFTLAHFTGGGLRTIGADTVCGPKTTVVWNPAQFRYQQMYPKGCTYLHGNELKLYACKPGLNAASNEQAATTTKEADATKPADTSYSAGVKSRADAAWNQLKGTFAPLNFPTRENSFTQIWEAKTCCVMVLTAEQIMKMALTDMLPENIQELINKYNQFSTLYETLQTIDSIGQLVSLTQGNAAGVAPGAASTLEQSVSPGISATDIANKAPQ